MDAQLADELREATDQLLDITPARPCALPPSPHLQQSRPFSSSKATAVSAPPRLATFSSSSKLEVLHSPTDVRPWQWLVPPASASSSGVHGTSGPSLVASERRDQPIRTELGSNVLDDADDNLPSRGLSSRVRSVKAATAHQGDAAQRLASTLQSDDPDQECRAASPSRLRVRTPLNDIYINQYGERVVQGKVVGRMLGGRPRPSSRNGDTSTHNDGAAHPSAPRTSASAGQTIAPLSHSKLDPAAANITGPPAFFLESFPDAFAPAPSTSIATSPSAKKTERRPSKGGPPSIIKAPHAVVGAFTLKHSGSFQEAQLLQDTSFQTASDFGSPSSSSSKQFSLSPGPSKARLAQASPTGNADEELARELQGLQLHSADRSKSPASVLLSPSDGTGTSDSARSKIELPSFRRPTPTIELSQAKADPVVLHGNRRQARASGVVLPQTDADSDGGSTYASPAVLPPALSAALPTMLDDQQRAGLSHDQASINARSRFGSASEPSSPLQSPRHIRAQHEEAGLEATSSRGEAGGEAASDNEDDENDDDKASLESAPSSLISLPVSTLTSSSRSPSHHSLERRRSTTGSILSHTRRRSSSHHHSSDVFAREIRIRGWSKVGSQARGWVVFELHIITKQGTPIIAHKRFSSFVKLRTLLLKECKEQAKWLPELPTRRTGLLSKYDAKYLEKRRRALQRWLEVVALDKVWGSSEALREWVLASD
ncbi:uncharacterized protein SPSC_04759 [Sporisorium scitamineum]|uniref:Endosomal/vacuolar adapter protein YPT35 n=1 Tax=Sporisorium scitamineum TaxID=49012 RepID=A0A0F7S295_9BASI|nr:uncharacterized protein SPSC_04759 [Sporisorium scitamineum]CDW96992.1 hypothetical protein [Sporisorium scitamineum]